MEQLQRPGPARPPRTRLADWVGWYGPGRLVLSALAVVVVGTGAYWMLRVPQPPIEGSLPRATSGTVVSTLPAPVADVSPVSPGSPGSVMIHVTGAVVRPGVYELPPGARVQAAVDLAGGATPDGDPDAINLAAVVADGARIYVPVAGEELPTSDTGGGEIPDVRGPVDVNRASITELDALPGIGPATASAIVTERERNGPFLDVDDLLRVPGIGPAKLATLRDLVTS